MRPGSRQRLLHNFATQSGEDVARPAGLIQRGGSYGLRVRVPDKLRPVIGKREVWKSFGPVSFKDACRLARLERVVVDRQFDEAEAKIAVVPPIVTMRLSDEHLVELARAFLRKMEDEALPIPMLPDDREAELAAVNEDLYHVGRPSNVEDAGLQRVALGFADWASVPIDRQSGDFLKLCEVVKQAWLEHIGRRAERLAGRPVSTIDPVFEGVDAKQPATPPLTLARAIELYKADPSRAGAAEKTRRAYDFRFRAIADLIGADRQIASIRRDDVRACRDDLLRIPANANKHFPGMPLKDAITAGERRALPKLSPKSVNLYVELLSSLFKWAEHEEMVTRNPAAKLAGARVSKEPPRRPLQPDELAAFLDATDVPEDDGARWAYWMARIAPLTGMRFAEIAGFEVRDLERIGGHWCFKVRANQYRGVKSLASTRTVPVHPRLIELGLPGLLEGRATGDPLLGAVPLGNGASLNAAQKRLGRIVRSVITDRKVTFHSSRHNFRDAARAAEMPLDVVAALGGWDLVSNKAMEGYGSGHRIDLLAAWVAKIDYPDCIELRAGRASTATS
jgi:integrase